MSKRIPGIPTEYKGIRFRSRLEAKWAAFFDRLGWGWQYEPFDLNGWIPDFCLKGARRRVLVEVKPFEPYDDSDDVHEVRSKMESAVVSTHAESELLMLVGPSLYDFVSHRTATISCAVGEIAVPVILPSGNREYIWDAGVVFEKTDDPRGFDLSPRWSEPNWKHVFNLSGGSYRYGKSVWECLEHLFNDAGNEVQWKGRGE